MVRCLLPVPGMLEITQSLPGRRFQERYRRKHAEKGSAWKRCGFVCAGILLTVLGVFFLAVPGPGIPILAVGRTEVRLRRVWKKLRR